MWILTGLFRVSPFMEIFDVSKLKFLTIVCVLAVVSSGCAMRSKHVQTVDEPAVQPGAGQAEIVFMRPSSYGAAVQASVYNVTDGEIEFIGIVSSGTRVNYAVDPGEHRFMVVAENADFMEARLVGDKTYYALVSPRMGVWRARFSLLPVRNDADAKYSLLSDDFEQWIERTEWVSMTESARSWFESSEASIREKYRGYIEKWQEKAPEGLAALTLDPGDGVAP